MTEPTDDELDAVIAEHRTRIYPQDMHPRFERAIMLAAIAKWGTPPTVAADSVQEDAARYRWPRINAIGAYRTNDGNGPVSVYHLSKTPAIPGIPEETDAAIDAARAAQKEWENP